MERCATCRFWTRQEPPYTNLAWGDCAKARRGWSSDHDDSLAYGWDAEGYRAGLDTHESFGCVMHEQREADGRLPDRRA